MLSAVVGAVQEGLLRLLVLQQWRGAAVVGSAPEEEHTEMKGGLLLQRAFI